MKTYKVICPLFGFQIQNILIGRADLTEDEATKLLMERGQKLVEGIDLISGVKVRRISREDFEDLATPIPTMHTYAKELSPSMFVLEKHITIENQHQFEANRIMQNIILALRLMKKGNVSGSYVFYVLVSEKRRLESWSWDEEQKTSETFSFPFTYILRFEDIPTLREISEKIAAIDFAKRKNLDKAFKRFQRAYQETDPEDQLIDFLIAFEALFLKGEKAGESRGDIIAIACSHLLGKNEQEREEVRQFLTKAYSIRNCIVHGSEYRKPTVDKEYEMPEFVSRIEGFLRESTRKLLD